MINNSVAFRNAAFLNALPTITTKSSITPPTVQIFGEYFVSSARPAARSEVDYLMSPVEQIRTQINSWLSRYGSPTRIKTEDATLLVAPRTKLSKEYIDSYEPAFRAVTLYRAHIDLWNHEDINSPSDQQRNTALLGLANLILSHMPAPFPMFLEDGTIGAYWRRGRVYASIDFEVSGEHCWVGTDGTQYVSGVWKDTCETLPRPLISKLLEIAG